ncbi:hypothetical protein [Hydrogenophaga sp.]|uniref:hypothetical protein n=1 Tax=Hydrogenophaga sp. TaxID=1904254 RepID=UPI002613006B|nr:hypothetical protein [Hydrogenophaga sp.]MDM7948630.1 hypothetical protein [Hydrogenophaga sp.]
MNTFVSALREQRWDDHRYYHHSTINQTLHLISATSFVVAYVLLFVDPALAALVAWLISMVSRQSGHFFFEPKGYDHLNQATHEHKEEIKIGYNLRRKVVLMAIWAASPLLLVWEPGMFGLIEPHQTAWGFVRNVGWMWLYVGVGGLVFRVLQLWVIKDLYTGIVWATKIVTDPFHDIILYHKAPAALMRGEMMDPGHGRAHRQP